MDRKYTHIRMIEKEILAMRAEGKSRREIYEHFGMTKKQYENFLNRHNRAERRIQVGILPRRKGRPPKGNPSTEQEKDNEIKRLKMENELLRSFLQVAGRK